ncbi:hypothetical protein COCMIDRAFT_109318 [Bipolaris oryzae ATCC 44560]|uniref:Uncharacterized protein n=1 Tax=Bipolaris oryzae ATCC 44560 TaxID=930090 RepID=W6YRJ8_COCMI|nr:uncharacterized protein COCMIDRAFT_109318 [Bipolaris oryzae ATCC 44560]EUC40240.1 hypothetical protein COCMIDRAFT_109318 [Bipolaris oryzae ATCC 44560]
MTGSRLVIGLDCGTTYTGVAFCEISGSKSEEQHIEIVHDWPSRHGNVGTREKVPSEVAYLDEGLRWGSDIPPYEKRHMWTKLELDNHGHGEAAKIIGEMSNPLKARKPPVEIIAGFLAQVKGHLIKNLDDKYGKELWRTLPITLVVTVPAVWSDVAKYRTMQAIEKAGFNSLEFKELKMPVIVTTEPEAAALYTIKTLRGTAQDAKLSIGDGFIVCDMGGGTVDLIAYRVTSIQPTVIEEATVGSGAQCGGSFIDRAFLQWLERRLGTQDFVKIAGCRSEEIPRTSLTRKAAKLLQDFTMEVKSGFSGTQTNYLLLPSPLSAIDDDEKRGISDGELKITADDTRAMFDSCLCQTYEQIQEQIRRARISEVKIKYVFMVGGFSESPYMFSKIRDFVKKQEIQAIRPPYAWSAVVRDAATKGLEKGIGAVVKRKSRRHYGTSCGSIFKKHEHIKTDMYINIYDGKKRARNQMKWLIKKGQTLVASEATHAATELTMKWWSVYHVAVLTVDSNDIPLSDLKRKTSPCGRQYYSIGVTVHISLQSSLEFYVTIKGKKFGSLTVSYD